MPAQDKPASLFLQALTCDVPDEQLATLPETLAAADRGMAKAVKRSALPSYNLYTTRGDVTAFGYTSRQVVLQPGRILMLVPVAQRARVESMLGLTPDKYSPSSKDAGAHRSIVAYQLSSLPESLLVGCQCDLPTAASWGAN